MTEAQQKKKIDTFLDQYKELENLLSQRETGATSIFDLEQSFDVQADAKKMQLCRLTRNFLQHEKEIFIVPSDEMAAFIKDQSNNIKAEEQTAKDIMKRITPLKDSDKISDGIKKIDPGKNFVRKQIPVVDKNNAVLGVFDSDVLARALLETTAGKKLGSIQELLKQPTFVSPDIPAKNISGFVVVTSSGDKAGKYKGVIQHP